MPDLHAQFSPSSFAAIELCPAQQRIRAEFKRDGPSRAADHGTGGHQLLTMLLDGEQLPPIGWVTERGTPVDEDMIDQANWCHEWIIDQGFDRIWTAVWVPVGAALGLNDPDSCWGEADVIATRPDGTFVIVDAKMGWGEVPAQDNPQLGAYLLGALYLMADKHILGSVTSFEMTILQPQRGRSPTWTLTLDDLAPLGDRLRNIIATASMPDAPFVPGEKQCQFCPASGSCRAQAEWSLQQDFGPPETLTNEELGALLEREKVAALLFEGAREHALARLALGQVIPGWKRVEGITRRVWRDPSQVFKIAKDLGLSLDEISPRALISPAQADKIDKTLATAYSYKPQGSPTLAPETDRRPALGADFTVLDMTPKST